MSRIAFFTESLPPAGDPIARFSFDLIKALADQQHEVRVFSTYHPGQSLPLTHSRIEIVRPFRNWGWTEIPKSLPVLVEFQPDVLHFVQPRAEALGGWTNAMAALPVLAPLLGRAAVVTSFYDFNEETLKKHKQLLVTSDVVTVSNRPQLDLLEHFFHDLRPKKRPAFGVVSVPSTPLRLDADDSPTESLKEFVTNYPKSIFLPGDIDEHRDREELFRLLSEILNGGGREDVGLILGGGWGNIPLKERHQLMNSFGDAGSRLLVTGGLNAESLRYALAHAQITLLAPLAMTSLRLAQTLSEALASGAVLAITHEQSLSTPIAWRDRENAFLIDDTDRIVEIRKALAESLAATTLTETMRRRIPEFVRTEALDQPANSMSRLYSEALAAKRGRR